MPGHTELETPGGVTVNATFLEPRLRITPRNLNRPWSKLAGIDQESLCKAWTDGPMPCKLNGPI